MQIHVTCTYISILLNNHSILPAVLSDANQTPIFLSADSSTLSFHSLYFEGKGFLQHDDSLKWQKLKEIDYHAADVICLDLQNVAVRLK